MSYLENFGVLTGIGVDVFEAGAGVFKPTREAESNTKNFESALLHWQTHAEFYVFFRSWSLNFVKNWIRSLLLFPAGVCTVFINVIS